VIFIKGDSSILMKGHPQRAAEFAVAVGLREFARQTGVNIFQGMVVITRRNTRRLTVDCR
jgi:hypothetical protein